MTRWPYLAAALTLGIEARPAQAQHPLTVTILSAETDAPVTDAVVGARTLQRIQRPDWLGVVRFYALPRPDTLVVAAIGFRPDTLVVNDERELVVRLTAHPVTLAEVTVAEGAAAMLSPAGSGAWTMPGASIQILPAVVEPDPLRALAVVPSVTFSSPLSARPLLRGYDASATVMRLDGFEIVNPYHIGGAFSSFPADATEEVSVATGAAADAGDATLAGTVDLRGRSSSDRSSPTGGLDASLASATGWLGTRHPLRGFLAARVASLDAVTELLGEQVPYSFQDQYTRAHASLGGKRSWEVSFYASRDVLGQRADGQGMEWWNLLLGNRLRLAGGPYGSLDLVASANRVGVFGNNLPALNSSIDITNRFDRASVGLTGLLKTRIADVSAGASVDWRHVRSVIAVRWGDDYPPGSSESRLVETHAFFNGHALVGGLDVVAGLRLDASREAARLQPRLRILAALSPSTAVSLAATRACRLYQLLSDQAAEPEFVHNEFWLDADGVRVAVPCIEQLAGDWDQVWTMWSLHASLYASRGSGIGELRPVSDQRSGLPPFRFGASRTRGVELRAGWQSTRPTGMSAALTYVWSRSDRRWDDGIWRPWALDRRNTLRLQLDAAIGKRWTVSAAAQYESGQPITPVAEVVGIEPPPLDDGASPGPSRIAYRYGPEGSGRSAGTFRTDLGARVRLRGPGSSQVYLGLSVLNAGFGPVAPEVPLRPEYLRAPDGSAASGVRYVRRFGLPAIPSVTARIEF